MVSRMICAFLLIYESSQVSFREIQILVKIWVNTRGALDSGGHEGDLWIRVDMGALGAGNRGGEPWIQATAKCCFGLGWT